jgi:hypothetical protein
MTSPTLERRLREIEPQLDAQWIVFEGCDVQAVPPEVIADARAAMREAADAVARTERLVKALEPFARFMEAHDADAMSRQCRPDELSALTARTGEQLDGGDVFQVVRWGDLRQAAEAHAEALSVLEEGGSAAGAESARAGPHSPALNETQHSAGGWRPIETVADLVNNLLTLDQAMPVHGAIFVEIDGRRRARVRPLSLSREKVVGPWIESGKRDGPWNLVIWSQADERAAPLSAEGAERLAPPSSPDEEAWAHERYKLVWQVRDTCARAERAEFLLAVGAECYVGLELTLRELKRDYQQVCRLLNGDTPSSPDETRRLREALERANRLYLACRPIHNGADTVSSEEWCEFFVAYAEASVLPLALAALQPPEEAKL